MSASAKPDCYMERPEEVAKNAALCLAAGEPVVSAREYFQVMSAGNKDLFNAQWTFWNMEHAVDDIVDEVLPAAKREAFFTSLERVLSAALLERDYRWPWHFTDLLTTIIDNARWDEERKELARQAWNTWLTDLKYNPFVQAHRAEFHTILVQTLERCLAGDEMAHDPKKAAFAPAVRCGDVDALLHMVYLARGWDALRAWGKHRAYDLPDQTKA